MVEIIPQLRKQSIIMDGKTPDQADVSSGVPQGTVTGPPYFLAFINDLPKCTSSDTGLFANDGFFYKNHYVLTKMPDTFNKMSILCKSGKRLENELQSSK